MIKNFDIKYLPLVAAYPDYGRKTINGFHYVNDKLLHETEFAKDPKNPVLESNIQAIVKKQSKFFEVYKVYDAAKNEDFYTVLENINSRYKNYTESKIKIFAGTAKFFSEVLKAFLHPVETPNLVSLHCSREFNNLLVIAGSFNKTTKRQLDNFYREFVLEIIEKNENYIVSRNDIKNSGKICVIESPREILENYSLKQFIERARELLEELKYENTLLILTGGDTAFKAAKEIGIFDIEVVSRIATGIVLCRDVEKKLYFVLKPGGFGDEEFLAGIAKTALDFEK